MRASIARAWADPQRRRRLLTITVLVSALVTLAHFVREGRPFHEALYARTPRRRGA